MLLIGSRNGQTGTDADTSMYMYLCPNQKNVFDGGGVLDFFSSFVFEVLEFLSSVAVRTTPLFINENLGGGSLLPPVPRLHA